MPDNITVTIDGQALEVASGTLIIEAAKELGIEIPTFCYDDRLRPVGACRMCLVEVEKMPKLIASCATPVAPNMVIHTKSERVVKARTGVLQFLLINHPLDCPTCDKGGECPLQDNTYDYGPVQSEYKENKIRFIEDELNQKFDDLPLGPEIFLNRNRCIMCFKCVRIVRELAGEADLGVFKRGSSAHINIQQEIEFTNEFSGNTVEYCPVGALTSKSFRYKIRDWLLHKAPSICNLCSDGCNINIETSKGVVYRHMSRQNPEIDDGWLCDKGRYGFDISKSADRIINTHIRRGNNLETCGWDEAIALVTKHLSKILEDNRGSEVAAVGSPMLSNEEAFSVREFFEKISGTSAIDFQTDYLMPIPHPMIDFIGLEGTISDVQKDDLFLIMGCDIASEHPILSLRIRKAISRNNAKAVFIGSYDKRLGNFPVENIRIPFSAEPYFIQYLISKLNDKNVELPFDIEKEKLDELINLIKSATKIHIISGNEFFNHPHRDSVFSLLMKLKKILNSKLSILPRQGNYMGVSRFGLLGKDGNDFSDILKRINHGEIKTLFIFGSNPVDEYPDRKYVKETLKKLDFLVNVSPYMNSTTQYASIVFPQALPNEYSGSFVNIEGRIQRFQASIESISQSIKPVWRILGELSNMLDSGDIWYDDNAIREEMANTFELSEKLKNISNFGNIIISKRSEMAEINTEDSWELPKAQLEKHYLLTYKESVHHSGWLTEHSDNIKRIAGNQYAVINPADAKNMNISEGQTARIGNNDTAINIPVRISGIVNRGEILVVNSFSANPVNRLLDGTKKFNFVNVERG